MKGCDVSITLCVIGLVGECSKGSPCKIQQQRLSTVYREIVTPFTHIVSGQITMFKIISL